MNTVILFCVEQGLLEDQALLLAESINTFIKDPLQVVGYSPRKENYLSEEMHQNLLKAGVEVIRKDINTRFLSYPIANKLLSCADFEINNPGLSSIMFVDTDTLFFDDPRHHVNIDTPALFLRPVDNKGPGSEGKEDEQDKFWNEVFNLCQVDMPEPQIWTTVRPNKIRNYFNAGLVWAHKLERFYQQWLEDFLLISESQLRPFGWTSRDGDDFRCLDQVALAVTATRYQKYLTVLPESYNYPLPFKPVMNDRPQHPKFNELVHIHYHKWFQHPCFLDHILQGSEKQTRHYQWLKNRLPLKPTITASFKC